MWWYIRKSNSNAEVPASAQGLLVPLSLLWGLNLLDVVFWWFIFVGEAGNSLGTQRVTSVVVGRACSRKGISVEEGVKRREEGAVGSFCCLWLKRGSKADRGVVPLGRGGQAEGVCTSGSLTLAQQRTVRQEVNSKWGSAYRKGQTATKMRSGLNRHKK